MPLTSIYSIEARSPTAMLFIDNKYLHLYNKIVERASSREKLNSYTEKHHIVPRSLGGSNDLDNLVRLTGREHFIVHRLLVKITSGEDQNKMIFALNSMMNRYNNTMDRYTPNSRVYEHLRILLSEAHKKIGRTKEHKSAISKAHTGKHISSETRKRMSESVKAAGPAGGAVKGSTRKESTRKAISKSRKGIKFTEEHRRKLSEAAKRRVKNKKAD
jgi:5-methylcytosine-specific restriction endonuclease McrA